VKTQWDYTELAPAYLKRPDYSGEAIDEILRITGTGPGSAVCDVGAGVAHLTLMLLAHGMTVTAVEPNDAMREGGEERTNGSGGVTWHEATGEDTGQPSAAFDLVTFGSSFNVTDRRKALAESHRILKPGGWFACLWNHRDLSDPIQSTIEGIIFNAVPDYRYGTRRKDQSGIIAESGLFDSAKSIEGNIRHLVAIDDCIRAWRSHATLQRQTGERFHEVVDTIAAFLKLTGKSKIEVPYTTHGWVARKRGKASLKS
jgi:ubiquinone/menaquinone biosynthesis C-methylase UbiE